jgi:hypothetical protein
MNDLDQSNIRDPSVPSLTRHLFLRRAPAAKHRRASKRLDAHLVPVRSLS